MREFAKGHKQGHEAGASGIRKRVRQLETGHRKATAGGVRFSAETQLL
ncbi:hypothetical protein Hsw_2319 [Hymenobacter swuensis DY53]|uniref:Uncharacterized protein n=1 Tax=Hymenobacter swuensis DY53 TaxID=1227739 RepID=W8EXW2_9BACT|nr:hypothetical protein Hsw_2319 [Hymenobacter swuensis DY53]